METIKITPHNLIEFGNNLAAWRRMVIKKRPYAPTRLELLLANAGVVTATTAHVRLDGWLAYTDGLGERRVPLDDVRSVEAFYN